MSQIYKQNGSATITLTSTPISLGSIGAGGSLPANRVDIQALSTNVGSVIVGASGIQSDQATGGIALAKGDTYEIELLNDLNIIFIAGTAGDKVAINWWVGDRN